MVLCMCVCFRLCVPYLHLDLHTAVRELLNHALNPYERLHLSDREREWTRSGGRALSWTASQRHTSPEWHGGKDRERLCLYKGDDNCSQFTQTHTCAGRRLTELLFMLKRNWVLTCIHSLIVYFLRWNFDVVCAILCWHPMELISCVTLCSSSL